MAESQVLKDIYKSGNPVGVLEYIKTLDYQSASKKILQASKHPFVRSILYSSKVSLPRVISDLRESKSLTDSGNLEGELAWLLNSLIVYKEKINNFLKLEDSFQHCVLLDDYQGANDILNDIDKNICVSYWSIENRFTLEEKLSGTESNWDYLKYITNNTNSSYTLMFSHFYSKKAENDTTVLQYQRDLESVVNTFDKEEAEYLLFKLGYSFNEKYKMLSCIVNRENTSSIIDKYILLIEIVAELCSSTEYKYLADKVLHDLAISGIADSRITRLLELNNLQGGILKDFNPDILYIFELYSQGNYKHCAEECKKYFVVYPSSLELYEIYCKCLLELETDFITTNVSVTVDEILKNLYNIYKKNDEFYTSKENLFKAYINFPRLNFYKQLLSLNNMLTIGVHKKVIENYYFIFSKFANPQLILFNDLKDKLKFPDELQNKYLALKINYAIATDQPFLIDSLDIPKHKADVYKARIGYYYPERTDLPFLINLQANNVYKPYLEEEIMVCIFFAYLKESRLSKAISLIVDCYFKNKYLIERLDKSLLVNYVVNNNYDLEETNIDLPLFFYIENVDSYYLYASLEQFLSSLGIERPSQINTENYFDDKMIFMLSNICTVSVLNNFYLVYESDDEVVEERIEILRKLIQIDDKSEHSYLEEIAMLLQKQKINRTIQTVNDGKISLNFSRIKTDKEYNIENSFNRFLKIRKFSDKNDLALMDLSDLLKSYKTENINNNKSQAAAFVFFKSLFFEVVDHFLFSKEHGLDGDLSTRMRHGVLENQLRGVFSSNYLIATKGIDNTYSDINYWKNICEDYYIPSDISDKIQLALKDFSKSIDSLIAKIVKDYIQVQSNRHTSNSAGLFNYKYPEEFLWVLYGQTEKIDSYEVFLNNMFDLLTTTTERLLKNISLFFQNNINKEFLILIENLQELLNRFIPKGEVWTEINHFLQRIKTQIEAELYEVSKWFKINNYSNYNDLDIETIVHTAVESINIFNSHKVKPNFDLDVQSNFIRGVYYIDIFKILIDNCIKRSLMDVTKLFINISVKNEIVDNQSVNSETKQNSIVTISITNNLSDIVDLESLDQRLFSVSESWNSDLSLVNSEGGSGFYKIMRILKYDIQVDDSSLSYKIQDRTLTIIITIVNPYNP